MFCARSKSFLDFRILFCGVGVLAQDSGAIAGITVDGASGKLLAGMILTAKRTGLPRSVPASLQMPPGSKD